MQHADTPNRTVMKKFPFLILMIICSFFGCRKERDTLTLSPSVFESVESDGERLKTDITCNSSWMAIASDYWLTPDKTAGSGDATLTITVLPNHSDQPRRGTVTIVTDNLMDEIKISQLPSGTEGPKNTHYTIPVVFHVLYQNAADPKQYVDHKRLADILAKVNKYYKGGTDSPDMNLSFVLADTDPNGKAMLTPGVEYIRWRESYPIDCDKFMNDDTGKYVSMLWDPNSYVNVMVYNFAKTGGGITLGISHLPIIYEGNAIPGLTKYKYPHLGLDNIKFPLCASINSIYINEESANGQYNNADINVTTSHELGHYLGLYHAFSEDQCFGTDYCDDTPNYDRAAYMEQFSTGKTFAELVTRRACDGTRFESHNIMDYDVSYADRFTPDQRKRVRAVLNYGLMIPGPKFNPETAGKTTYGPVDIPIVTMR